MGVLGRVTTSAVCMLLWVLSTSFNLAMKLPGMGRVYSLAIHFMTEHRGWVSLDCQTLGTFHDMVRIDSNPCV